MYTCVYRYVILKDCWTDYLMSLILNIHQHIFMPENDQVSVFPPDFLFLLG